MQPKIRILHIDDTPRHCRLLREVLMEGGLDFELVFARNRISVDRALRNSDFDVFVGDFFILGSATAEVLEEMVSRCPESPLVLLIPSTSSSLSLAPSLNLDFTVVFLERMRGLMPLVRSVAAQHKLQMERDNALAQSAESTSMYHALIENTELSIVLSNENREILLANSPACNLFGVPQEEATGADVFHFMHPDDYASLFEQKQRTGKARGIQSLYRKDGTKFPAEVVASSFQGRSGQRLTETIIRDLSAEYESRNKLRTLSKAIEQSPVSITITDAKGRIEFVNLHFVNQMQYRLSDVLGKPPRLFNPGHCSKEDFERMWQQLASGKVWSVEQQNRRKDHTFFWERVAVSALYDAEGNICNYIVVSEDITDVRNGMDNLLRAKEVAEESDRLKTAFLHNISHEIRTPMNAIIGFSRLLKDRDIEMEKKGQFVDLIVRNGNRLLHMINGILQVSMIEAGQCQLVEDEYNINALMRSLEEYYKLENNKSEVTLECELTQPDERVFLRIDGNKLKGVLMSLIDNALKYTVRGTVRFTYLLKGDLLEFQVSDTGIGISKEQSDAVFVRFQQAEQPLDRMFEGVGLGLYLSKWYLEMMGGSIWFESERGEGTTFYFTVPYRLFKRNISS
jgi:PAS domain S-box-containing protein